MDLFLQHTLYWPYTCGYSNGDGFMSDVADAIEKAKKEIFITDWM